MSFKKKAPRWETFKFLFNITIFRYLVLWFSIVPILASLFKSSVFEIRTDQLTISMFKESSLPFPWELLWLSSFIFLLAYMFYQLRCPGFIKQYNSYGEYEVYGHDPRWLARLAADVLKDKSVLNLFHERCSTKNFSTREFKNTETFNGNDNDLAIKVLKEQTVMRYRYEGEWWYFAMPLAGNSEPHQDAEKGVFWEIFGRYSDSRNKSRWTILFLLIASAIPFIFVLFMHIYAGMKAVVLFS